MAIQLTRTASNPVEYTVIADPADVESIPSGQISVDFGGDAASDTYPGLVKGIHIVDSNDHAWTASAPTVNADGKYVYTLTY